MYTGPCLTPLLYQLLIRSRIYNIVVVSDIEKAYLQISVAPEHRDFLRFLWYDDLNSSNPKVEKYRFKRVIFGACCSQYLLNLVVRTHLKQKSDNDPDFVNILSKNIYVDDVISGVTDYNNGIELYRKCKIRFLEANFNLRKLRTNSEELRKVINEAECCSSDNFTEKVLGINWNEYTDTLEINSSDFIPENCFDVKCTKREVLRVIAGFYDPIGFIQSIVQLKILFQQICTLKIEWDDELPDQLQLQLKSLITSIRKIEKIIIT